jgi:hypothetical protein
VYNLWRERKEALRKNSRSKSNPGITRAYSIYAGLSPADDEEHLLHDGEEHQVDELDIAEEQ